MSLGTNTEQQPSVASDAVVQAAEDLLAKHHRMQELQRNASVQGSVRSAAQQDQARSPSSDLKLGGEKVDAVKTSRRFTKEEEAKLVRKMDIRLLPLLSLLYLLCFLDRVNIGNARVIGLDKSGFGDMERDLGMSNPSYYNWALSIFFFGKEELLYTLLFLTKVVVPIMITWGLCATLMAFTFNFGSLMAARAFLGVFEAGFFPGILFYLSFWYRKTFAFFLPTIIKLLGFTALNAQLLSAPPYVTACIVLVLVSFHSDWRMERSLHMVVWAPCVPLSLSWMINNQWGQTRAATATAMMISFGNLGGILGPQIYRPADALNGYKNGHIIMAMFVVWCIVWTLLLRYILMRDVAKASKASADGDEKGSREIGEETIVDDDEESKAVSGGVKVKNIARKVVQL
ncbi:hypothetical protein BC829DRAFT_421856 [Chytridium lagenaria]|nr:hypothetical protein BC829DRAFT_421856 [Chytridium lagenaria]